MKITAKGTVELEDGSEYEVEVDGFIDPRETGVYDFELYGVVSPPLWECINAKHSDQLKAILQAEYDKQDQTEEG